jgi:CRISPR-associated protein Cas5t
MPELIRQRLFLRIGAPFAVCRPLVAGWYRPTAGFVTHSAVYGLLLNVAGVESRLWEHESGHGGEAPASLMRDGLPSLRLALGLPPGGKPPRVETIYQQLHNYPVGASGMPQELTKGTKNNITPVRREILCDLSALLAVDCDADFGARLRRGLRGEPTGRQYGLPFLGDNSFLLDRLDEVPPQPSLWYKRVDPAERPRPGTTRLTQRVDRKTVSGTTSALFAPMTEGIIVPPDNAWVELGT